MKSYTNPHRSYRNISPHNEETAFQVVVEETDLNIVCTQDLREAIFDYAHSLRGQIKAYGALHPMFLTSLSPLPTDHRAHPMISAMLESAKRMNVGPMAAVAGAIAQGVADHFAHTTGNILVENGGDIFMHSTRQRTIGLLPDPTQNMTLGLSLDPEDFPCAVCSSSSAIGHSLSLGKGDLVVVRATTGALADAAATRFCNDLTSRQEIQKILGKAEDFLADGIQGILVQCGGKIGIKGRMELVGLAS